jgi:hypothetical protein
MLARHRQGGRRPHRQGRWRQLIDSEPSMTCHSSRRLSLPGRPRGPKNLSFNRSAGEAWPSGPAFLRCALYTGPGFLGHGFPVICDPIFHSGTKSRMTEAQPRGRKNSP